MADQLVGTEILIRGIVQGVGFRPFIYTLAARYGLTGWVCNSSRGVEIVVNGSQAAVADFLHAVRAETPPLARIDEMTAQPCPPNGYAHFTIRESRPRPGEFIPISPDVAICPDCQRELFDPSDRRHRYPFINCTNCGPRFTIIQDIPYDRPKTTMSGFNLCPECLSEYENPLNRRFHAQPIACPRCGPQVWYESGGESIRGSEEAIQAARQALREGKILAVKGLGGYHLACDAANPEAVGELRRRKRRVEKPFALMAWDLAAVQRYCRVSAGEAELLESRQKPIVLLDRIEGSRAAAEVAPGQSTLGVMLPYTPLHLLLLEPAPGFPDLLVMTSGNLSEEPIAYTDEDARERLSSLADGFLLHDRPIHMRVDDSVRRVVGKSPVFSRRARGYAPDPLRIPFKLPPILSLGAELKNTFCLTRQEYAFVSHHIGDLENYETLQSFEQGIQHYERLFRVTPEKLACDLHPDYLSTRYAQERARQENLPLIQVQHHHAHLAACLAENGWATSAPAIGLTFDGTGYGTDGTIWGGEILVGGYTGFERRFHLAGMPLPGGDLAVRKPCRTALAALWSSGIEWSEDIAPLQAVGAEERKVLRSQLERKINTPVTTSMGRLFDAVASLVNIRQEVNYEGQAAVELEAVADESESGWYDFDIHGGMIQTKEILVAVLNDLQNGIPAGQISTRFHNGIVHMAGAACVQIRAETGIRTVALSGGVWQNRYLCEHALPYLTGLGFEVLFHRQLPPNDGCIALGQAVIAGFTDQIASGKD